MSWSAILPVLNSVVGGIIMAVAIWGLVTGKVVRPAESEIWKGLYDKSELKVERLEKMVDGLTDSLSSQNQGHLDTLNFLKQFIQVPAQQQQFNAEHHPRRRKEDAP